jgi:metal-dependent hydrolase (beta-lactamase superfamily II)
MDLDLMEMLNLPDKGANKPAVSVSHSHSQHMDGFSWLKGDENCTCTSYDNSEQHTLKLCWNMQKNDHTPQSTNDW